MKFVAVMDGCSGLILPIIVACAIMRVCVCVGSICDCDCNSKKQKMCATVNQLH